VIYGIAYHSPIDVMTLLPLNTLVTLNPKDSMEILITEDVVEKYESKIQLVFASPRVLFKHNLPILDQGAWGKILTLTATQFEQMIQKERNSGKEINIPEWARSF
jgi:hypothetical protein